MASIDCFSHLLCLLFRPRRGQSGATTHRNGGGDIQCPRFTSLIGPAPVAGLQPGPCAGFFFVCACAEWSTAGAGGRVLIWFFWVTVTSAKQVQSASNCHQTVTKKKPRYLLSSRVSIWGLVGPEWLEHSTYGLRVRKTRILLDFARLSPDHKPLIFKELASN